MQKLITVIKKGNVPSGLAALVNTFIAIMKLIAANVYGNAAMFASGMHSLADSANQFVIFIGSILGEKKPTKKFPNGFGRINNLVCLIAVIVISILAYETILEGIHIIMHPTELGNGFMVNIVIMIVAILLDSAVWFKAMKVVNKEARDEVKGIKIFSSALKNFKFATPSTRLVFIEDVIAVFGGTLALIAIIIAHLSGLIVIEGIVSIIIGIMMISMAVKIALDNAAGLIGITAPVELETLMAKLVLSHSEVKDIKELKMVQEGTKYHLDCNIELAPDITISQVEEIIKKIEKDILETGIISDIAFEVSKDDGVQNWKDEPITE